MKYLIAFGIGGLLGAIGGAIAHERDIATSCAVHHRSGLAGWFYSFSCTIDPPQHGESKP